MNYNLDKLLLCPTCGVIVPLNSIICPYCGAVFYIEPITKHVFATGQICQKCGYQGEPGYLKCEKCGAFPTIKCPQCGNTIEVGNSVCDKCDLKVEDFWMYNEHRKMLDKSKRIKSSFIQSVFIVLPLAILSLVGSIYFIKMGYSISNVKISKLKLYGPDIGNKWLYYNRLGGLPVLTKLGIFWWALALFLLFIVFAYLFIYFLRKYYSLSYRNKNL